MKETTPIRNRCTIEDLSLALRDAHQVIDVREASEYEAERIAGTRLVPLSALDRHLDTLDRNRAVYVVCRSGSRAAKAAERLGALGWHDVRVVDGGLRAWAAAGLPVERGSRRTWSLERQVRFTAGLLVLMGVVLSLLVHPSAVLLAGLVGGGLMFSAATDTCTMGMALARMPWNRASTGSDSCHTAGI
jgi:rhodanese-related sulfurtransferase